MSDENKNSIMYLIAYLVPVLTGVLIYVMYGNDNRMKFHGVQAILLGIAIFIIDIISYFLVPLLLPLFYIFDLLIAIVWLYGIYVGYEASINRDIFIPYIGDYAANVTGFKK